ncbi:transcription initiation factor TFIID subunit 3 isoform X3 [Hermetia illucens]|uniref:transcription initiation factor TFIID subunit 3 isoform X3 n=1 Tax=Hermetia illucens TaxID=343691 RepID=UPI0018CC336B|nr:transcription initiation factor TFIID subunit 3 isoform X3 [Hermetia illucens]
MEEYTKKVLRIVVAQICQAIGWHTIQSTPLELLTDILHKYTQELAVRSFRYTQLYSRTEANLDDVGLAFRDLGVNIPDLLEYINNVDSVPCAVDVPHYPVRKESSLNLLKPGSKEVITRPVHIHEHLPPIFPEKEDDTEISTELTTSVANPMTTTTDPSTVITDITNTTANSTNIANNSKVIFKKPDASELAQPLKKSRVLNEDEGRPTREISSVMMTSSGFISPAREGKLPDSKTPMIPEYKSQRLATPPPPVLPTIPERVAAVSTVTASPTTGSDLKPEKRQKRQKNINAGLANSEAKEQRKLERHKAKMKKRGELLAYVEKTRNTNKKTRAKETKAKHHPVHPLGGSPTKSPQPTLEPSSVTNLEALPPVSLPADLTIKSEKVPVGSPCNVNLPTSALGTSLSTSITTVEVKPNIMDGDAVKLKSEPDKQKYNIFKKISSKKCRDDTQKGSLNINNALHHSIYSGFPPLPESTTIRPIPPQRSSSPPHTDPNVIVVDDDTPPRSSSPLGLSSTQILPIPSLLPGTTVTASPGLLSPFLDKSLLKLSPASAKKQSRKPRSKKQQQILVEQSAPLNLSNEVVSQPPISLKTPRKRQAKVGRPSKRSVLSMASGVSDIPPNPAFPTLPAQPRLCSDSLKRDDISPLNIFKDNQFLSGVQRYPIINPFHLLAGPGLIPSNNFMHPFGFPNPFNYSDFMGLRPPMRPPKVEESLTPPPLALPPDLESSVYCNVPPLVPDSLKHQLSPALISKGNKSSSSATFGVESPAAGGSFSSLKTANSKSESHNLKDSSLLTKLFDAPIEISDDEKSVSKSDTEQDKSTLPDFPLSGRNNTDSTVNASSTENVSGAHQHHYSPSKSITSTSQRSDTDGVKIGANDESDNMVIDSDHGDAETSEKISSLNEEMPNSLLSRGEKKRDREHKKGKRGKDGKIKKKKDKKDKSKNKEKAEKRKEEKKEKDRSKKKKEKRKDKLRVNPAALIYNDISDDGLVVGATTAKGPISLSGPNENQIAQQQPQQSDQQTTVPTVPSVTPVSSTVPKLTLKFGSPQSIASDDSPEIRKLNSKSSNGGDESTDNLCIDDRRESSPELARISPLVTRPPKQKTSSREKNSDGEQTASTVAAGSSASSSTSALTTSGGTVVPRGPGRPSKNQNSAASAVAAAALVSQAMLTTSTASGANSTPTAATSGTGSDSSSLTGNSDSKASMNPQLNDRNATSGGSSGPIINSSNGGSAGNKGASAESIDAEGNQVWICPACGRVDDGTPMIGCDGCDAWYHWVCVGIQVPPDEREDWYCRVCIAKKQEANGSDKKKKRKKKNKTN